MYRLFLIFVFISGCATTQPEIDNLSEVTPGKKSFILKETISFKFNGVFGTDAELGLVPGRYMLHKENQLGQFYLGESRSVWWPLKNEIVIAQGGIWLPTDSGSKPKIYYFFDSTLKKPTLNEAVAARNEGMTLVGKIDRNDASNALVTQSIVASNSQGQALNPIGAGVASGVAGGIIAAMIATSDRTPIFYPSIEDAKFVATIKAALSNETKALR